MLAKASYDHLLERMKVGTPFQTEVIIIECTYQRDQVAFKVKHNAIERALNERNLELNHANEDSRKAKQLQQQSKYFLDELMKVTFSDLGIFASTAFLYIECLH